MSRKLYIRNSRQITNICRPEECRENALDPVEPLLFFVYLSQVNNNCLGSRTAIVDLSRHIERQMLLQTYAIMHYALNCTAVPTIDAAVSFGMRYAIRTLQ